MKRSILTAALCTTLALAFSFHSYAAPANHDAFHVLALYSTNVEADHVDFANDGLAFLKSIAPRDHFELTPSTNWDDLNDTTLKQYQLVLWLDDSPHTQAQRDSFEKYMANGGAWLGFHAAGYNDESTKWPWFVDFLGGAVFYTNSWPPLPAKLIVDDPNHPIAKGLPKTFTSPANEWYIWKPSPRLSPNVKVLLTLDPENYPIGFKDVLLSGDLPVVWTNTKYKMIYMNMGHGSKIMTSPIQNKLIENSILWLGSSNKP
ncbi:ThuA domain-containing protein [Acidicapsa ligni]|uniref:ThuA domain-containing protein n=1 Tax=Acidicapsa ligni TaxID=542300 RepID=UPI0021DFF86C|nr:ThuA domain-containing protein [Acidicapsa ligni]